MCESSPLAKFKSQKTDASEPNDGHILPVGLERLTRTHAAVVHVVFAAKHDPERKERRIEQTLPQIRVHEHPFQVEVQRQILDRHFEGSKQVDRLESVKRKM